MNIKEKYELLKKKAHYKIFLARNLGVLIVPNYCSVCNKYTVPEAHHPNYTKPYNIVFLCKHCHLSIITNNAVKNNTMLSITMDKIKKNQKAEKIREKNKIRYNINKNKNKLFINGKWVNKGIEYNREFIKLVETNQ